MKNHNLFPYALLLAPLLLIAGCDRGGDDVSEDTAEYDELTEEDPLAGLSEEERVAYDLALVQLEPALGDEIENVQLLSIATTNWPDSSLGCAKPGVDYLQAVTPGHSVRIGVRGTSYVVNTGGGQAVVCNLPGAGVMSRPSQPIKSHQVASVRDQAINDLAEKLGVDPALIKAGQLIPAAWTDASLGCPEQGVEYEKSPVTGFQMYLGYGERAYTYNTDGEKVIACPPISMD